MVPFIRSTLLLLAMSLSASAAQLPVYIGTYTAPSGKGEGIYRAVFDTETGALSAPVLAAKAAAPSWLAFSKDGKRLYAALERDGIASFQTGPDGVLEPLQTLPLKPQKGDVEAMGAPCHLSLDATGRFLLAASYGAGTLASFAAREDGSLAPVSVFHLTGTGPNAARQKESHAHQIVADPSNRFVYVCDLGGDDVALFAFDPATGALTPQRPFPKTPPGSGPRHLALSADGRFAYVNGEMAMNVTAFARDTTTGMLTALQTLQMEPSAEGPGTVTPSSAEVLLHPSGKWLYVSNRGWDALAVFRIGEDGKLVPAGNVPLGVKGPRGVAIDPSGRWLLAAGEKDDSVTVLKIDPESGATTPTGQRIAVGSPVALAFAP